MHDREQEQQRTQAVPSPLGAANYGKQSDIRAGLAGALDNAKAYPVRRAPIRQRIYEAIEAGDRANARATAARRAQDILDRVPELGELLDALDQF